MGNIYSHQSPSTTTPVESPTWYGEIRYMFTPDDITHMKNARDFDLSNYDEVTGQAGNIYGQVAMKSMPPDKPWSDAWVKTFLNWMSAGYPKGVPPTGAMALRASAGGLRASRIRKEINTLSPAELNQLIAAFKGIMAKDPDDPNSYFVQAGFHWLPAPLYCQHHVPGYNPWHRAYLLSFENALRSVKGCETVTLPYWDITNPVPDALKSAPFDSYTLPRDIGGGFSAGYKTSRFPYPEIEDNLRNKYDVDKLNATAMAQNTWEGFHGLFGGAPNNAIIEAHDSGHVAIGPTLEKQSVASFDPLFWFFHCNWDRLFWKWQQQMDATTLTGLMSTITDSLSRDYFTVPSLQELNPFTDGPLGLKTVDVVDSVTNLDVDYAHPPAEALVATAAQELSVVPMARSFRAETSRVNIRVSGINRLNLPGSFDVHLLKGDKVVGTRGFFQPAEVTKCANCVANAFVHFDFDLPISDVGGDKLSVWVEPRNKDLVGERFPANLLGEPKIQLTLPLTRD